MIVSFWGQIMTLIRQVERAVLLLSWFSGQWRSLFAYFWGFSLHLHSGMIAGRVLVIHPNHQQIIWKIFKRCNVIPSHLINHLDLKNTTANYTYRAQLPLKAIRPHYFLASLFLIIAMLEVHTPSLVVPRMTMPEVGRDKILAMCGWKFGWRLRMGPEVFFL